MCVWGECRTRAKGRWPGVVAVKPLAEKCGAEGAVGRSPVRRPGRDGRVKGFDFVI